MIRKVHCFDRRRSANRTILSTFDTPAYDAIAALLPEFPRALLVERLDDEALGLLDRRGPDGAPFFRYVHPGYRSVTAARLARCHAAGQTRPTPLLLRYGPGDYNRMHQDVYGRVAFPLQVAIVLSREGDEYRGGEFLVSEQRPRMQTRVSAVPLAHGEAIVFANAVRPVAAPRGSARAAMRHGVSELRSGERLTLGLIFHALFTHAVLVRGTPWASALLVLVFVAHYVLDRRMARVVNLPSWYLPLRLQLTTVACLCLVSQSVRLQTADAADTASMDSPFFADNRVSIEPGQAHCNQLTIRLASVTPLRNAPSTFGPPHQSPQTPILLSSSQIKRSASGCSGIEKRHLWQAEKLWLVPVPSECLKLFKKKSFNHEFVLFDVSF